ncbi:hypothetical protein VTH82DRAFT_7846 [Thermothelomyces myriococcoides]
MLRGHGAFVCAAHLASGGSSSVQRGPPHILDLRKVPRKEMLSWVRRNTLQQQQQQQQQQDQFILLPARTKGALAS